MASVPTLDDSVNQARQIKNARNATLEKELKQWIESVLSESFPADKRLAEILKDGVVLCRLLNKFNPGIVKNTNFQNTPFKQRENIEAYLKACLQLGMSETDLFPTIALYEEQDLNAVFSNLSVLKMMFSKDTSNDAAGEPVLTRRRSSSLVKHDTVSKNHESRHSSHSPSPVVTRPRSASVSPASSGRIVGQRQSNDWGETTTTTTTTTTLAVPGNPVDRGGSSPRRGSTHHSSGHHHHHHHHHSALPELSTPSLNETLQKKKEEKYDRRLEEEVRSWVERVLGEPLPKEASFGQLFKDGVLLCRVINKLKPGTVPRINESRIPFKQMENIEAYLKGCRELGLPDLENFNTTDLFEEKDLGLVIVQISSLASHAGSIAGYTGPHFTYADKRRRSQRRKKEPRLFRRVRHFDLEGVRAELKRSGGEALLRERNEYGQTALHVAAQLGQQEIVELFLARSGSEAAQQQLLNRRDKQGETPLLAASQHARLDMVAFLLERGADPNIASADGATALHCLARLPPTDELLELLERLVARGARLDAQDAERQTPLHVAAGALNGLVAYNLIKCGAAVNAIDAAGETALHKAARLAQTDPSALELCCLLIDSGADPSLRGANGSALDLLSPDHRRLLEQRIGNKPAGSGTNGTVLLESMRRMQKPPRAIHGGEGTAGHTEQPAIAPHDQYRIELGEGRPLGPIEINTFPLTYRFSYAGKKHWNYVGFLDADHNNPAIFSLMDDASQWRVLVRTKDGQVEHRMTKEGGLQKPEDALHAFLAKSPAWSAGSFQLCENLKLQSDLLDVEENDPQRTLKFPIGIVYSKPGDKTQWDMWNNQHGSKEFEEFLVFLGQRVKLQGWDKYAGGLDTKNNSKGVESIYTEFHGLEIMFHVSTFLPYHEWDEKKLCRSRVIGNDITMIVYREGDDPFDPQTITGAVSHVFVVVQPLPGGKYRVACCSKDYVPEFAPAVPSPPIFERDETLRNFLLTKLINGHAAAQNSKGLRMMYTRPRLAALEEIVRAYYREPKAPTPKKRNLLSWLGGDKDDKK